MTRGSVPYDSPARNSDNSDILFSTSNNQGFVATGSSRASANQIRPTTKENQGFISTLGKDLQRRETMGPNAPGTRRKHAQPLSFRDNLIGSQIVESSESSLDLNAQNMWFSGALGQTEWPFGEARNPKPIPSVPQLKISGVFNETAALFNPPTLPTPARYRARRFISTRSKYLTGPLSNAATNEKDSEMRPGSPEEAKWTDHNWQEQQAMKSNPNGEDQILGHPTYTLEFKNYLRAHDQFSLNKIQELERIAAVTHTHLGWFHHDEHGVKHLHRQWILILARNLEMLPSAPLDVRNAYWIQKADAFEPIYNFWMQHLGLDPNKRLKGQEVPNPAHPPVDDKGKPLEEMPYSDNEISDKENSPRSMSPSFTRRTTRSRNVQTNIPTIKAPKAFTDKKTLPRPQAANNTDTSVPRFAGRGKSNKRLRSENVDASDAGKRAPKRLRGRPRKGVAPGQASAE